MSRILQIAALAVICALGILVAVKPVLLYRLESRFRSSAPEEPPRSYLVSTRIEGVLIAAVAGALIAALAV